MDITGKTDIVNGEIKLEITEELEETTYLDRLYLRVNENKIIELDSITTIEQLFLSKTYKQLLRQSDNQYMILNNGDEYYLEFNLPKGFVDFDKLEFVTEGYFIKHKKEYHTIESPLVSIIINKLGGGLYR